jgi:2-keto-3-deoxy-L-rhamnonate aldolase RhmA
VLIVAIIEEARALDEIEAIAAAPRLDALFIGISGMARIRAPEIDRD